jgi:hypothetical protein
MHSIEIRVKEHHQNIRLEYPDKSAVVKHSISLGHHVYLQDTRILPTKSRYMVRMIGEVTEVELHVNNMNGKDGLCLSWSWKPLIHTLKNVETPHHRSVCPSVSFSGHKLALS